ncbi:MAG: DUF2460 domain-containing protein [Pseudomonas sp.]|nr:DUF2460 domain-containing protein [Pseudomonas sp.]
MPDFLEERISSLIRMGSSYVDDYAVDIVTTSGGQEYRSLVHPFPVRKFDVSYLLDNDKTYAELQAIYHRAHGKFAGFRARCFDEWSSNGRVGTPTAFDQPMGLVSAGVYQLRKRYGTDKAAGATGYAYREIRKPVAGTVRVGIGATEIRNADWSVDATTGRVTFAADKTVAITGISKAASAVITLGTHAIVTGQSVQISGVSGMTQINGMRALVTAWDATTITVAINSTAFGTYTGGGVVHTRPQAGESVTAGFEFDFPVRFNTTLPIGQDYPGYRAIDGVELIELINP